MDPCPICNSGCNERFTKLHDDRYGARGSYDLVSCARCGHHHLRGAFTNEQVGQLYTQYYPRATYHPDSYVPRKTVGGFNSWLNGEGRSAYSWVPRGVRVLDIGCGFGESLEYHRSRGCEAHGVEVDENVRPVAEKFGLSIRIGAFEPRDYDAEYFDYVTLDQVVEHAIDPLDMMRGMSRVMKRGGRAVISTPNVAGWGARIFGRRWINWHAPYHLQLFTKKSMGMAAERAGLVLDTVKTITPSDWLLYQQVHLVTFPQNGQPSSFWSPHARRTAKGKLLLACLMGMHFTKINHCITRFFDALGLGDNYLFILKKP